MAFLLMVEYFKPCKTSHIKLLLATYLVHENLLRAKTALMDVKGSIDSGITNDFLAMELKHALSALSEITLLHPARDYGLRWP